MNSRYLVIQLDIGQGTQWGASKTINPIRDVFIPSVRNYCRKYKYDYSLVKESVYEKNYGDFNFLESKKKHYSFD